ncbi:MAG: ATP synthase subunit I [Bacteroidetes bacterium]|nr:MAG: ATP synthase subunit I [Bacteroidota bacterium]
MIANEITTWIMALLAGVLLGGFFFGGLWWTVKKGLTVAYPGSWFLASILVRTGVVLAGFYVVAGGQLERMAACLVGFILARLVVLRYTNKANHSKTVAP